MKTEQAKADFSSKLTGFLLAVRDKSLKQFIYNIETNVPKDIVSIDESPMHALRIGIASAFNKQSGWSCEAAVQMASEILEDANCHTENAALLESAKKMGVNI